jgi:hypothetical protein
MSSAMSSVASTTRRIARIAFSYSGRRSASSRVENAAASARASSVSSTRGSNVRRSWLDGRPCGRSDSVSGMSRRTRSRSVDQVVLTAKASTVATSATSSPPLVATMNSDSPSGRSASSRSQTSTVTGANDAMPVEKRKLPIGSSTGARSMRMPFV